MSQLRKRDKFDLKDGLVVIAVVALVVGLALIYLPIALIIPSVLLLVLGFLRRWY